MFALIVVAILGISVSEAGAAERLRYFRTYSYVLAKVESSQDNESQITPIEVQAAADQAGPTATPTATTTQMQPVSQNQPTPIGTAYPAPTIVEPTDSAQTLPDSYPAPPPTPVVFPTNSYPAVLEPTDVVNGTPFPNIGSPDTGPTGDDPGEDQVTQTEPVLGTVFLWIGFGAAFAVFISSVVGAIYYYDRRRAGSK